MCTRQMSHVFPWQLVDTTTSSLFYVLPYGRFRSLQPRFTTVGLSGEKGVALPTSERRCLCC